MIFKVNSILNSLFIVSICILLSTTAEAKRTVRAGLYNYKPLVYADNDGTARGLYVEILNHVAKNEEWDVQYVPGTWQEGLDRLENNQIDLLLCIGYTEERKKFLDFPAEFLLLDWGLVYKPKGSAINSIMELDGKTVGALKGSVYTAGFQELVKQFHVNVKTVEMNQVSEVFKAVDTGKVDVGVTANIPGILNETGHNVERTPIIFTPVKLGYGVHAGRNPDLISVLNREITALKADKTSVYYHELDHMAGKKEAEIPKHLYWVFVGILFTLGISLLFVYILRRQVRKKTEELKNSNKELSEQGTLMASIINGTSDAVFIKDTTGCYIIVNDEVERLFNRSRSEIIGHDDTRFFPPKEALVLMSSDKAIMDSGHVITQKEYITTLNIPKTYLATKGPVYDDDGNLAGMFGISRDITDIIQAEHELQESRKQYRNLVEGTPDLITRVDTNGRLIFVNHSALRFFGLPPEECIGRIAFEFIHQDDYESTRSAFDIWVQSGEEIFTHENRIVVDEGTAHYHIEWTICVERDDRGILTGFASTGRDVSDIRHAHEEKDKLESQLYQSQKMESIGSLAGGVAHDFNNKLCVILGYAQMAKMATAPESDIFHYLQEICKAGESSADLTRQLLAFARKQTIAPKDLDLNETVSDMLRMLKRMIGEDIKLVWQPASYHCQLFMDPSQIDQILVNLCVNSRDAIADTGWISIESTCCTIDAEYCSSNLDALPGDYVRISVSDNGCGMDKETQVHIFEPFYTTKEIGKGTGLGLATVYGIVKQNNGFITIYSERGIGTTFDVYLPRSDGKNSQPSFKEEARSVPHGDETILLVEDEPAVLNMTALMLRKHGYTVIAASNANQALQLLEEHKGDIHLLMTDVIMPELNGHDLSKSALTLHSNIKCLFMSGYTADVIGRHGMLDCGVNLIQKPFTLPDMAVMVREVLDGD